MMSRMKSELLVTTVTVRRSCGGSFTMWRRCRAGGPPGADRLFFWANEPQGLLRLAGPLRAQQAAPARTGLAAADPLPSPPGGSAGPVAGPLSARRERRRGHTPGRGPPDLA